MKLSIDLSQREEIAAAVPLLQHILNESGACAGQCSHTQPVPGPMAETSAPSPSLYQEFREAQVADTRAPLSQPDPAVVFGGLPTPGPTAAEVGRPLAAHEAQAATFGAANVPQPPAAVAPAEGVTLDKNGLPWDSRIHSSGKTFLKDGAWRYKGGIPPERIQAVEAELRASLGNVPPAAPTVPAPPVASAGAASPTTSASLPAAPVADPVTFEQFMPRITAAAVSKAIPPNALTDVCVAHGLASVVALQQQPAYIPLVWAALKQAYPALV